MKQKYVSHQNLLFVIKAKKILNTAEQQNKSASKNKYKILKPLDATKNAIKIQKINSFLDNIKLLLLLPNIFHPL